MSNSEIIILENENFSYFEAQSETKSFQLELKKVINSEIKSEKNFAPELEIMILLNRERHL